VAWVEIPPRLREHTHGRGRLEVEAANVRALLAALDERFPGLGEILGSAAIAIDGEIINDPLLEPIDPDSEVHFLPKIGGGV
jgi:molybdopterin converting factor small subunit